VHLSAVSGCMLYESAYCFLADTVVVALTGLSLSPLPLSSLTSHFLSSPLSSPLTSPLTLIISFLLSYLQTIEKHLGPAELYEEAKIGQYINDICEECTARLTELKKPFKYASK